MRPGRAKSAGALIDATVRGERDEAHALRLCKQCPELVTVALGAWARKEHADDDARRLTKRLRRYAEYIFTFLDWPDVRHDNNFGRWQIRPAVILRKNSPSNRSDRGAATQAVLMSVYRTLRLRGLNPTKTTAHALRTYLTTGQLPPLPQGIIADSCPLTFCLGAMMPG